MRNIIVALILLITSVGITGCIIHPYIPDVQQGNMPDQKKITHLQKGMSKAEVRALLGDPVVQNTFDRSCWIYAYTNQINGGEISKELLTVCFDIEGKLASTHNKANVVDVK